MNTENLNLQNIWAIIAWGAAALVLLANAGEKICGIIRAIKAPDSEQNDRLANLENDVAKIKGYLENDKKRLDTLSEGDKVTKHAILALLGHGIDGNNVDEMISSKHELEKYLINR